MEIEKWYLGIKEKFALTNSSRNITPVHLRRHAILFKK